MSRPMAVKALAQKIGEDVREGDLDFFEVVHDRGHDASGRVVLEKVGVLMDDAVEHGLAEVGDSGEADVVDQIVAEIIADAAQEKYHEDGSGDHAVDNGDDGRGIRSFR